MKLIAINGSPRKEWNTATLLKKTIEGAESKGAQTELIHLYDLTFKGCISWFACKEKNGKSYGKCVVKDALKPIFKRVEECGALILASPIYLGSITGEIQSFMERLVFPYLTYTDPSQSLFPKKIKTGFIYTMGIPESMIDEFGYTQRFANIERFMTMIFGAHENIFSFDTYQFDDYAKYISSRFDPAAKLKRRKEVFPQDCRKAYEMGVRFSDKKTSEQASK